MGKEGRAESGPDADHLGGVPGSEQRKVNQGPPAQQGRWIEQAYLPPPPRSHLQNVNKEFKIL